MNLKQRQFTVVQRTYAEALLGAARRTGSLQRVQEEAKILLQVVKKSPRLLLFMENPNVEPTEKLALLDRVFKARLSPVLINLLHVLAARRRTTNLDEILDLFQELTEQAEGIFQATVTSAYNLSVQDKLKLKASLEQYTRSRLKIDYGVDPGLIGGIVFRFRDLLIDSSLRSALDQLRRRLTRAPLARESA
jgi:F-type H+-transporting ATPase subunit delta